MAVVFDFNDCDASVADIDIVVAPEDVLPSLSHVAFRYVEPVGAVFERAWAEELFASQFDADGTAARRAGEAAAAAAAAKAAGKGTAGPERTKGTGKRQIVLTEAELDEDWYDVMGMGAAGDAASSEEIRLAYRKRCLETHPDKHGGSDVLFKKVQRAFEILNDPDARRSFDSSRPFDDTVPAVSDVKSDDDFFKMYGPTFLRNSRWSVVQPVPTLGEDSQSAADARKFYDFWLGFSSWRDFSHEAELEATSDGMDRYEKRFIARENERQLEKLRRQEAKRIRTLVEEAMRMDPRLRRQREAEQRARDEVLAKRAAEIRRREEEEARKVAEEQQRVEDAKAKAKAEVERRRTALRTGFQALVEFFTKKGLIDTLETNMLLPDKVRKPNITFLMQKTDPDDAGPMVERVVNAADPVAAFNEAVTDTEQRIGMNRYGEPIAKTASAGGSPTASGAPTLPAAATAPQAVWSPEDVTNLRKAIAKFPPGTVERWRRIANALRDKFTEEQVLAKTKELEHFGGSSATSTAAPAAAAPVTASATASATSPAVVAPQTTVPASILASAGGPAKVVAAPNAEQDEWTVKQQKQLETALRELKDYKEKDKFIKVASFVEGKTPAQCYERFKYIASIMKKK